MAIVHPILRKLMEASGETVNLAVLDQSDHQAIIIDQVQCTQLMRMSAPIGGKLPMHASGAGKAFLANLNDEQVSSLLHRKGLHAYTHATLVSPVHLKEDLAQTRKRGYSFDDEEHALGLRCVASCIYDEHGQPFAAISISGPLSRITDDRVTELGAMVIRGAKEVTLGIWGNALTSKRLYTARPFLLILRDASDDQEVHDRRPVRTRNTRWAALPGIYAKRAAPNAISLFSIVFALLSCLCFLAVWQVENITLQRGLLLLAIVGIQGGLFATCWMAWLL